jgi:hypothetical protein
LALPTKGKLGLFIKRLLPSVTLPAQQDVWSIGIYVGESPFNFKSPSDINNPVLTGKDVSDVPAKSIADPFILKADRMWYLFFEVMNQRTAKGEIAVASSKDGMKWTYQQIVLSELFHLSYPYVFEWMSDYYMVPESFQAGSIRLYRASKFPTNWSFAGILKSGKYLVDTSIFRFDNKWWLFTETNPNAKHDTLRLFHATELMGPWLEHPHSPIVEGNPHIARPGGRVIVVNDTVIRYAQDCYPAYGTQVRAFEITELTPNSYHEQGVDESRVILTPSGSGWNASGMHHIDPHIMDDGRWLAAVDGWHPE